MGEILIKLYLHNDYFRIYHKPEGRNIKMKLEMKVNEFFKHIENLPPTPKIYQTWYKIQRFSKDLWYNLHSNQLKRLVWLIKYWWISWDVDYGYSLVLLKWNITNLKERIGDPREYDFHGREKVVRDMSIFLECLNRLIEDNYGDISKIGIKKYNRNYKENKELLLKYFNKIDRWWI